MRRYLDDPGRSPSVFPLFRNKVRRHMKTIMRASLLPLVGLLYACASGDGSGGTAPRAACPPGRGEWVIPATGRPIAQAALFHDLATRSAVLLGESHTSADDHRWQLQTLAALYGRSPNLVLGFEAFPRRLQPVLDRWVAGEMSEQAFLEQTEWHEVWGYPAPLYMPLFEFARMNRVPMVALNVERKLVSRIGKEGWAAVPPDEREGVGAPATPSAAYVASLARVYAQHRQAAPPTGETPAADPTDPAFKRFVEAQTTWDRAMAEAIAATHRRRGHPLVVAVAGRGHVEYGYGILHQLADLGLRDAAGVVTWLADRTCGEFLDAERAPVAAAVFGVAAEEESTETPQGPRLGVRLGEAENGVAIVEVTAGSVAEAAGLEPGDIVRQAAGRPFAKPADLAAAIRRQPFGTWLPLAVERDGATLEVIAKFPARPHPPMDGPNPHKPPAPAG